MIIRGITVLLLICTIQHSIVNGQVFYNEEELEKFETRLKVQNFVVSLLSYPFESLEKKEIGVLIGEIELMPTTGVNVTSSPTNVPPVTTQSARLPSGSLQLKPPIVIGERSHTNTA